MDLGKMTTPKVACSYTDWGWLVGIYEADGSAYSNHGYAKIEVTMTDEDTVRRWADLTNATFYPRTHGNRPAHWKPRFTATLQGKHALTLLAVMYEALSMRRKEQALEVSRHDAAVRQHRR